MLFTLTKHIVDPQFAKPALIHIWGIIARGDIEGKWMFKDGAEKNRYLSHDILRNIGKDTRLQLVTRLELHLVFPVQEP